MDPEESPAELLQPPPAGPRPSSAGPWLAWLAATLVGPAVLPSLARNPAQQDLLMGGELILLLLAQIVTSVMLAKRLRLRPDGRQGSFGCLLILLMIGSAAVGLAIYVISCANVHPVTFH